jgi:hypothetical protein
MSPAILFLSILCPPAQAFAQSVALGADLPFYQPGEISLAWQDGVTAGSGREQVGTWAFGGGIGGELAFRPLPEGRSMLVFTFAADRRAGTFDTVDLAVTRGRLLVGGRLLARPLEADATGRAAMAPVTPSAATHRIDPFVGVDVGVETSWFRDAAFLRDLASGPLLQTDVGAILGTGRVRGLAALNVRVDGSRATSAAFGGGCTEVCEHLDLAAGGLFLSAEIGVLMP